MWFDTQGLLPRVEKDHLIVLIASKTHCSGCELMEHRTLGDSRVQEEFTRFQWHVVRRTDPSWSEIIWYPTVVALSDSHQWLRHEEGFLPPYEFIPFLRLALTGKLLRTGRYQEAISVLDETRQTFAFSGWIPECLYYQGVASHLAGRLRDVARLWRLLRENYPESVWAHKASLAWEPPATS